MSNSRRSHRRDFLKRGALLGLPMVVPRPIFGQGSRPAPSERIVMGAVGVGNRGGFLLGEFLSMRDVQMVALCDVRGGVLRERASTVDKHHGKGTCATTGDFEELLQREDIEAIFLATPTHWHVPIALEALRRGKDLYMEKPVGLSLEQGQLLRKAVKRTGRVFQLGTQQRSSKNFRFACELVRNGRIGRLQHIDVGVPGGQVVSSFPEMPIPDDVDFDRWLGPAPLRPFTESLLKTGYHEKISDFVPSGFLNAWGIHHLDIAQWGNNTEHTGPAEIEGSAVFPEAGLLDTPVSWDVNMRFATGVTLRFTDNSKNRFGVVFRGEKGWVHVNRGFLETHPASLKKETIGAEEVHLAGHDFSHESHARAFLDCVRSRRETVAPVEVAVRSDTLCQLSDIAVRLGRKLKWDPDAERFVNDATANRLLTSYPLREPWRLWPTFRC